MPTIPTHNNTPTLRFPDFQNDGDWEMKRLGEVCDLTNGMAFKPSDWKTKGVPIVRIQNLNDEKAEFNYCDPEIINEKCMIDTGTLLFSWSGTPGTSFGAFIWNRGKAVLNQHIFIVEPIDIDKLFLKVSIDANMASIIEKTHGGAGLRHITKSDFEDVCVFVPKGITEQRRIAACLSVLDEMLAATNEKLDQLKAYKKGLMQKLFPAKGKKLPELRFKEFEKDGEWEEKRLGDYLYEHKTKSDGKCQVYSVSVTKGVINQMEYLGRSFASSDTSNYKLVKPFDIVYTKSPTGEFPYGIIKQSLIGHNVIVSPLYGVFSPSNQYIGYIIHSYFESSTRTNNYLAPIVQKGAKNTIQISNDVFLSQNVCLPSNENEQRKIASCLSAMDETINAYTEKVGLLGQLKKGLMQRMFPTSK